MGKRDDARDIIDELYTLPPQAFTSARDEHVATAKNRGDRDLAAALARCKRPTVGAWLANVVALRRPDLVEALIELGETIRGAQGSVPPAQLRDLSTQRRRQLDTLLTQAQALAGQAGAPAPTRQQIAEAEATFATAMADAETAQLVRSGRVLKALSYSGFGQPGGEAGNTIWLSGAGATPTVTRTAAPPTADQQPPAGVAMPALDATHRAEAEVQAKAQEEARAAALAQAEDARAALAAARETEQDAVNQASAITAQIAALKEQLANAEAAARAARQARLAAERVAAAAERRLARHA